MKLLCRYCSLCVLMAPVIAAVCFGLSSLGESILAAREAARRSQCQNGLRNLSVALANYAEREQTELGSGDLLTGIPGDGPLSLDDIKAWLDDPKNHATLKPVLPLGMSAGQDAIKGIDKNPMTRAKIELGRQLYFDTRLSSDNTVSCASCHAPEKGYAFDTRFGVGIRKQEGGRNSPTAMNRILSEEQFWDGRAATLEDQAVGPIANPIEMGNTHEACVASLQKIEGYRVQFERVFGDGVTIENVGRALATFERAVVSGAAPWDYYERLSRFEKNFSDELEEIEYFEEDEPELFAEYQQLKKQSKAHPISESAIRGGKLFFDDESGCTQCHLGPNYTDELYHNLGVGMEKKSEDDIDWGRYDATGEDDDRGAFKTPSLRNIAQTAPYMHDGSQKTLEEVVEWYDKGGHANDHLSDKMKKLSLTKQQKADLVAFMKALTGPLPKVEAGRLPE